MNFNERTKYLFANTIKEMMKTKSLTAVRIKDLCTLCGTERQTFYYHFKDKYDLIAWIYSKDVENSIQEAGGIHCEKQLEILLLNMLDQRPFYKKAFEDKSQNALMYYIREANSKLTGNVLKKRLNIDTLTTEMQFAITFNSHAWIGCIVDWILNKQTMSASKYAKMMYQNTTIMNTSFKAEETL